MSKGMLGFLPLPQVGGLVMELIARLAGDDGTKWFAELKKFIRREPCWSPEACLSTSGVDSGELSAPSPSRSWREEDGVVYFSVTSDGTTGEDWIKRLEAEGFRIEYAKQLLRSPDFRPTSGVTTEVAVLKGALFEDNDRITRKIRAEAKERKLGKPEPEVACLIREKFTDKEIEAMGLVCIVAMHEPISDSDGSPGLLGADRGSAGRWLPARWDNPDGRWGRENGFAFAVAQAGS